MNSNGYSQSDTIQPYYVQPVAPIVQPTSTQDGLLEEASRLVSQYQSKGLINGVKIAPKNTRFSNQNDRERVFLFVRRHWSENVTWVVRNIFYSTLPFLIALVLSLLQIDLAFITGRMWAVILLAFYSLIITNVVKDFFDWYFDTYIITNERVLSFEFKPFAKYHVQEAMLESIQKIQEQAGGILSNVFGYGNLIITIEGPQEEFLFKKIPSPTQVRDILSDLAQIAKKYNGTTIR